MTATSIEAKALRDVAEGRLRILSVHNGRVFAECQGERLYTTGFSNGRWWCNCPARGPCCHLVALRGVVAEPAAQREYGR
jgi:uncharacterized Zn finger protein